MQPTDGAQKRQNNFYQQYPFTRNFYYPSQWVFIVMKCAILILQKMMIRPNNIVYHDMLEVPEKRLELKFKCWYFFGHF